MPDFCLTWFKLFQLFSSLFPLSFILTFIQPTIIYEIGLYNNNTNFNTVLLPCYTGALIGPLVAVSNECQQHFSLVLREALLYFGRIQSSIFELTLDMVMNRDWIKDSAVSKVIVNSIIGVLWEGVTHEEPQIRLLTVKSLTCATKLLTIEEISTQLFPPINSLVNDENSVVRSETAKTIAILQHRLQSDSEDQKQSHVDLEKRTMKMILQLMVDPVNQVVENIIRAMINIVIENDNSFKEDFFIPQIAMMINSLSDKTDSKLIEIILDFYDALLSSCCILSQSCFSQSVVPSLQILITVSKNACIHRHIQAQSLLRQAQSKVNASTRKDSLPTETKFSLAGTIRNPFSKRK